MVVLYKKGSTIFLLVGTSNATFTVKPFNTALIVVATYHSSKAWLITIAPTLFIIFITFHFQAHYTLVDGCGTTPVKSAIDFLVYHFPIISGNIPYLKKCSMFSIKDLKKSQSVVILSITTSCSVHMTKSQ